MMEREGFRYLVFVFLVIPIVSPAEIHIGESANTVEEFNRHISPSVPTPTPSTVLSTQTTFPQHTLAVPSTSIPPPYPHFRTYSFFSRATAPFEGLLRSCFFEDASNIVNCLKEKFIIALKRASVMHTVPLGEHVELVKKTVDGDGRQDYWMLNAVEIEEPDTRGYTEDVDARLINGFAEFLRGRAMKVSLPENLVPMVHLSLEEARGKKHKHLSTLITCIAVVLKTLALASIAFIAKKALLLGKLSLLLSAAVMMKKLMGGGGGGGGSGTSYEVVSLHRRAAHQRDMPRHGEVLGNYGSEYGTGAGYDREGSDSIPYGAYALIRKGKGISEWVQEREPKGSKIGQNEAIGENVVKS